MRSVSPTQEILTSARLVPCSLEVGARATERKHPVNAILKKSTYKKAIQTQRDVYEIIEKSERKSARKDARDVERLIEEKLASFPSAVVSRN